MPTEVALRRIRLTRYRFCAKPTCKTVYFGISAVIVVLVVLFPEVVVGLLADWLP